MIDNIIIVSTQVFILFVLVAVGFICNKIKFLNLTTIKQLTDFVLYIVTPCVIINSFAREFNPDLLISLLTTFGAAILSFAVNIIISLIFIKDKSETRKKIFRYATVFSNAGFMALPLQQAILGEDGIFYGAIFVAVFNIVNWTYGIFIISGDIKYLSLKKIIINPGVIGTFFGLILFFMPFSVPEIILKPIGYFASMNTPLPMFIIGFHLATAKFNIKGFMTFLTIAYKLILSPFIIIGILFLLKIESTILISIIIAVSAPIAASTTMFSEKFNLDTEFSATLVSVSTLLSIITMPIIIATAMNIK